MIIQSYTHASIENFSPLILLSDGNNLTGLYFADKEHKPKIQDRWICEPNLPVFLETVSELKEYVSGKRNKFDIPVILDCGTEFQKTVWHELAKIPFGKTRNYEEIAQAIGKPEAIRAVANAIGKNPISIIIPCHRVIGKNGTLTGYAGGLDRKKVLLEIEGVLGKTLD